MICVAHRYSPVACLGKSRVVAYQQRSASSRSHVPDIPGHESGRMLIERRCRLVGYKYRFAQQSAHRERNTLALTAAYLGHLLIVQPSVKPQQSPLFHQPVFRKEQVSVGFQSERQSHHFTDALHRKSKFLRQIRHPLAKLNRRRWRE